MGARIPLPVDLEAGPFAVRNGLELGVGEKRMRGHDLDAPFHGTRAPVGSIVTVEDRAVAYATRMPEPCYFSHSTAARIWGMPLPLRHDLDPVLDVAALDGYFVPSGAGVRGHRLQIDPIDVVTIGSIRLTLPARTWCDLAPLLRTEDLVAAGDHLISWRRPDALRLAVRDLAEAKSRFHGRRGQPSLRFALPFLRDRVDSAAESIMRVRFAMAGLPEAAVNVEVFDSKGRFVGMPDLSFPEYKVAFDYDGDIHRTDQKVWRKDLKRSHRFEDAGWRYVRGGEPDLRNSSELIALLLRRLHSAGYSSVRSPKPAENSPK